MNLVTKNENEIVNQDVSENAPNASRLISALRHLGYTNASALCDLLDNSIDAGATEIKLEIKEDEDSLLFRLIDNGRGMDMDDISQSLRLGSNTKRNPVKDLGFYGMGLVTAGISIAKRVSVLTRKKGGNVLYSYFDVDQAIENNTFDNVRIKATKEDARLYEEMLGQGSGTIVTLSKCDRLQFKGTNTYENKLKKE